jgi:hypothetical protein
MRFRFTTRDWIWFCIAVSLAIGWGMHVRYTAYVESVPVNRFVSEEFERQLRQAVGAASDERREHRRNIDRMFEAIKRAELTDEQSAKLREALSDH